MNFDKLNEIIPYTTGGKAKILTMQPYNAITLAMPGRHALDTMPVGGDYVVMVDDDEKDWTKHQFTHNDLFRDVEAKSKQHGTATERLMGEYLEIINGADPAKIDEERGIDWAHDNLHPQTFLYSVQCLAVAEHRRYHKFEPKFGGRFLPARFSFGISQGLWTAAQAADKQKYGRPGVEQLEREYGVPALTKELMG